MELSEHKPFGASSRGEGSIDTPHKFTGKRFDDSTGLYYYGARYYDPELGRFTQPDTIVQAPSDPQTLNRYTYVRNNPLIYTDPTGHSFWKKVGKFFKMAAAIIITVAVAVLTGGAGLALLPAAGAWALGGFVGGFAGTLINGGSIGQAVGMGFVGAFAGGVGSVAFSGLTNIARIAAMTAIGATAGASGAAIMGGNIGLGAAAGAAAGFIGGAVGGRLADAWDPGIARGAAGLATAAGAGAASAAVTGGNVGQGALLGVTGAVTFAAASGSLQKVVDILRGRGGEQAVGAAPKYAFDPEGSRTHSGYADRPSGSEQAQVKSALTTNLEQGGKAFARAMVAVASAEIMAVGLHLMEAGTLMAAGGPVGIALGIPTAIFGAGLAFFAGDLALEVVAGGRGIGMIPEDRKQGWLQ